MRRVTDETALKIIVDSFPARTPYRFGDGPVVIRSGQPARCELAEAAKLPLTWKIDAGPGIIREGKTDGRNILWPADLPTALAQLRCGAGRQLRGGDEMGRPSLRAR